MRALFSGPAYDAIRAAYRDAPLDVAAFRRRYARCDLAECQGMCCYGGVSPEQAEIAVIKQATKAHRAFFREAGLDITDMPFTHTADNQVRTDIAPFAYASLPAHFDHTACALRDAQGRCTLQLLGARLGEDAWWFKPLTCWLFPISLTDAEDRPCITIHTERSDPVKSGHYPGFTAHTRCGAEHPGGIEGHRLFRDELGALSELLGRDLLKELADASA